MTSHGGTYKVSVIGNNFTECQFNGISVRTRSSVISANTVTGASNPSSYGIGLYEGGLEIVRLHLILHRALEMVFGLSMDLRPSSSSSGSEPSLQIIQLQIRTKHFIFHAIRQISIQEKSALRFSETS